MSALPINDFDQRVFPRVAINGEVKYKLEKESEFHPGMMINISQTGALISLDQQLPTEARLTLVMEADRENQSPIEITAEVIRIAENSSEYAYNYGCMILDVKDL